MSLSVEGLPRLALVSEGSLLSVLTRRRARSDRRSQRPVVCSVDAMRIDVIDEDETASAQARAYAEYKLFATLARHAAGIRSIRVLLSEERKGAGGRTICAVNVVLEPSGSLVVRAHGPHPHGAIDRAAERMGDLVNRRVPDTIQP